jgi:hypothetical protein
VSTTGCRPIVAEEAEATVPRLIAPTIVERIAVTADLARAPPPREPRRRLTWRRYVRVNVDDLPDLPTFTSARLRGNGTFHHVSPKHLGRYVDEFIFRLNEGNVERHYPATARQLR